MVKSKIVQEAARNLKLLLLKNSKKSIKKKTQKERACTKCELDIITYIARYMLYIEYEKNITKGL